MEKLGLNEIRELFKKFYESKNHYSRGSFSLIPRNDKSLLIINSGMAPLKPFFAGIEEPPSRRMTTCQKCIRTADIENVGITARHGTFFEMLGSFSFGDYFKHESIAWGWEFITKVLEMPIDRVWVTIYQDDDEAYSIWKDEIGIDPNKIVRLGKDDNFWEIGAGPCGPCSEIYFDRGEEYGCGSPDCKPGCDCDRYIEFWNHVFTQFNNDGNGNYTELAQKNIDTGMGLERLACIMQGTDSIFDVDTIAAVLKKVEAATGCKYEDGKAPTDVSIRIITDHVRSATFMISDKIMPSNEGRGYVLRRLIRRAERHGIKLGAPKGFLSELTNTVIDISKCAYPELDEQREFISKILQAEEKQFCNTLDQGMERIAEYIEEMKANGTDTLDGQKAFKLHDTYGFPIDLTEEILADDGFKVNREEFEAAMAKQKELGKADASKKDFAWKKNTLDLDEGKTDFLGYTTLVSDATVTGIFVDDIKVDALVSGQDAVVILNQTPFYAESGGQASDCGSLLGNGFKANVTSVSKTNGIFLHKITNSEGVLKVGDMVSCSVCPIKRNNTARNHTATHLLHSALRQVLGDHVAQAGSSVDENSLRFDFNHYEAISKEDLNKISATVNDYISRFIPVNTSEMSKEEAGKDGAIGLFEDKYGAVVRVVRVGEVSKELCGGTHVSNSGQIGGFKIVSEAGVASGIRRIEAITGAALISEIEAQEGTLNSIASSLKSGKDILAEKVEKLVEENKALKKEIEKFKKENAGSLTQDLIADAKKINGIKFITKEFDDETNVNDLRSLSDEIKGETRNVVMVFAINAGQKVTFLVSITDDLVSKGYNAGKIIKEVAAVCGGGGGGKADMAQAGGKDASKINDAFEKAASLL